MKHSIRIEWQKGNPSGTIEVAHGTLDRVETARGSGLARSNQYRFRSGCGGGLFVFFKEVDLGCGAEGTIVTVRDAGGAFSFFLRDVNPSCPIWIPEYGVMVTGAADRRAYAVVETGLKERSQMTSIQRMETEPETALEKAFTETLNQTVPTWLGLSRNMRIFEVGFPEGAVVTPWVSMCFAGRGSSLSNAQKKELGLDPDFKSHYAYVLGRGMGCKPQTTRRLEEGVLPILRATVRDGGVEYNVEAFATLGARPLTAANLRGSHFLVADSFGAGHMLTPGQQADCDHLTKAELTAGEETVLCMKTTVENTLATPRYAWIKLPKPAQRNVSSAYDPRTGFASLPAGHVFAVCRMEGKPAPQEEIAVLLKPHEAVTLEWVLPHRPLSPNQARNLYKIFPLEPRRLECRKFWRKKLDSAARFELPEPRINEMVKAGLLHLDMVCYGNEPNGTITPTIGVYSAIGSESAPIIQFLDSMGCHRTAERCLQYFLDKQHEDGFIQNFGGYMLETGAALWSMGEHFRYTRDLAWVRRVARKLLKSCDFILDWRKRNMRAELRGQGFGMLDGKCADPEDPYHAFMLNGFAYMGLVRAAEMLSPVMKSQSRRLKHEAGVFRKDIRAAFFEAMAKSPVVPLRNGAWAPSAPPWVEARGPVALYTGRQRWYTHGTFMGRDTLIGPLWLIFQEVLASGETAANWMMLYHCDLMFTGNVAFSQPYYCRHDWAHLKRGEVRSFLKLYYHAMAGLADRETYTFWEHFHHVSPHKTHEEGWFLMQTRWMLYMEDGRQLNLMPGIPRAWLEDGKVIRLENVKSYFGPLNVEIKSNLSKNEIRARVECRSPHKPSSILIRLPHPGGKRARAVEGGKYDPERETVLVERFAGRCDMRIIF